MDERTKDFGGASKGGMRSRARTIKFTPLRAAAPLSDRADQRYYGIRPMKNRGLRIVTFSLAILVSLAAWGGFAYVTMQFLKKH